MVPQGREGTNHGSREGAEQCGPITRPRPSRSRSRRTTKATLPESSPTRNSTSRATRRWPGLKLIGFSIWERRGGNGRNVTFPARSYVVNGDRRSFALLRPIVDTTAQTNVRDLILEAYAQYEEVAEAATA